MLIQATTILNLSVAATDTQSKIGDIEKIIINPENGEVLAFVVKPLGFFKKNKILSREDILDIDKNGIVVKSEENLIDAKEIVKVKEIIDKKTFILGQKAITESKKSLGKISDLLIDTNTLTVNKYYTQGFLAERIFPADKVVKITPQAVVFSDDVINITPSIETENAAA